MRSPLALVPLFAAVVGVGAFAAAYTRPGPEPKPKVRLAVLVVFDQLRGDYPARWRPLFGPGGFARLRAGGAWFTNCHYPYGTTTTGPGHASILSGTCPDKHGIVNNNWTENGRDVYCATDARYSVVRPGGPPDKAAGGTPDRLLSETVADVLKRTHGPRAKVFGLSLKDRSAILPVGKQPDGALWFNSRFVTSTYYTDRLDRTVPDWVTRFNGSGAAERWFGRPWERSRPDVDYVHFGGPDDAAGEGGGSAQGRTFPHPTTGGLAAPGGAYYAALANSPYGNDLLLEFAKTCVTAEDLGADDVPDLLVVSFSSNDLIGHTWGPDSQEVLDVTLRSDALVADLLRFLDARVGAGGYALALTADHGVGPLPQVRGGGATRVDGDVMRANAEKYLRQTFGRGGPAPKAGSGWIEAFQPPWLYLNPRLVAASGRPRAEVARALAAHLAAHPDVARTFTRDQLGGGFPESDLMGRRVKRSYHPDRCGDVYLVLNPFDLLSKSGGSGTTHGSPHAYDTHVPLMVYGAGIPGGVRDEAVTPQATAAIFARILGTPPPADADFPVPTTLGVR